jgi:hypothetical protein
MYSDVSCPSRLLYSIYTDREVQCNTTNNYTQSIPPTDGPFGFYDELISFATCVSSFRNDDGTHLMLCIFYHCAPLTIYNVLVFF